MCRGVIAGVGWTSRNDGYEVSLERRKIYESLPDAAAEQHNQLRVIDESGDDHLFPARYFATIELPTTIRRALAVGYRFAVGRRTKRGVSRGTKAQRA